MRNEQLSSYEASNDYDRRELLNVHPPDWRNPEPVDRYNLVVIGAGPAGLLTALNAEKLGAKVAITFRASDMVSVYVRSTLVQLATPDAMRGRVSAVNSLFIGASNQLGEFESGVTAAWFGTVPSAVIGGAGTILVVVLWIQLTEPKSFC